MATFFCKKPNSNILGSAVHTVPIVTTQLSALLLPKQL